MGVRYITQIPDLGKFYGAYSPASKSESGTRREATAS